MPNKEGKKKRRAYIDDSDDSDDSDYDQQVAPDPIKAAFEAYDRAFARPQRGFKILGSHYLNTIT